MSEGSEVSEGFEASEGSRTFERSKACLESEGVAPHQMSVPRVNQTSTLQACEGP